MKPVEFLIQKEGDRAWLPIEKPIFAIETGKYRIVAHSPYIDRDVEVRINHHDPQTGKCQDPTQKYYRHTNLEGLIMILPFEDLKPGIWEFRCCGDILSELLGEFWQETLQLQVFEPEEPIIGCLENSQIATGSEILENFDDANSLGGKLTISVSANELISVEISEPVKRQKVVPQQLSLSLKQDTLSANPGESIPIAGRIEVLDTPVSNREDFVFQGKFCYQLKDAKSDRVILKLEQCFAEEMLPLSFYYLLDVPEYISSSLLLGEVILEDSDGQPLVSQPFTITMHLPEAEAEPLSPSSLRYTLTGSDFKKYLSETLNALLAKAAHFPPLDLDLPEPRKMKRRNFFSRSRLGSEPILPPKMTHSDTTAAKNQSLKLPKLPQRFAPQLPERDHMIQTKRKTPAMGATSSVSQSANLASFTQEDNQDYPNLVDRSANLTSKNQRFSQQPVTLDSLKLEERFLTRLNALAKEREKENQQRIE